MRNLQFYVSGKRPMYEIWNMDITKSTCALWSGHFPPSLILYAWFDQFSFYTCSWTTAVDQLMVFVDCYRTVLCCAVLCCIVSCCVVSCRVVSSRAVSCRVVAWRGVACRGVVWRVASRRVALQWNILYRVGIYCIISYSFVLHFFIPLS